MENPDTSDFEFDAASWAKLAAHQQIDPYLVWCLKTDFRELKQDGKFPYLLNFIVEFSDEEKMSELFGDASFLSSLPSKELNFSDSQLSSARTLSTKGFSFLKTAFNFKALETSPKGGSAPVVRSPAYAVKFGKRLPRFVTLRMDLEKIEKKEHSQFIQNLVKTPSVKRIQLGDPRGLKPDHLPVESPQAEPFKPWSAEPWPPVVLGVLEDAAPFAHAALLGGGSDSTTRVISVWDQSSSRRQVGDWRPAYKFTYGYQISWNQMNQQLRKHDQGSLVDEEAVYADPDVDMHQLLARASHGAAVLPLMAGAKRAAPHMPQRPDADGLPMPGGRLPDAASAAPIVVVQLPTEQLALRSGRWFSVNALDGLHFIVDQARRMVPEGRPSPPLVINVSYGSIAGPHDGSGMLESAIDELTDLYAQTGGVMAVVLAGGNTNGNLRDVDDGFCYVASGIHAKAHISPRTSRTFTLRVPPDKQFETYVEIWFDRVLSHAPDNHEVEIVVTPPSGQSWRRVVCNDALFWPEDKEAQAGLLFYSRVSQGEARSMALLVLAATQVDSSLASSPAGLWAIEVKNERARSALSVEAWVERDDTATGAHRPQSARFVDAQVDARAVRPSDDNTLTSIATGKTTFVAGSLIELGFGSKLVVSPYSPTGNPNKKAIAFSAVSDAGYALRSIRVSGSQSGMVVRASGTSVAAPQAARWLANQLADSKQIDVIKKELENEPPPSPGNRFGGKVVHVPYKNLTLENLLLPLK